MTHLHFHSNSTPLKLKEILFIFLRFQRYDLSLYLWSWIFTKLRTFQLGNINPFKSSFFFFLLQLREIFFYYVLITPTLHLLLPLELQSLLNGNWNFWISSLFLLVELHAHTFHGGGGLGVKSCPILATPWTVARQAPLAMGFSRQESWSGLPFPSSIALSFQHFVRELFCLVF